jgi:uncharacterized cofD-like protein
VVSLLEWQIPAFAKEGKSYLSIAIGCTGGRHRSVAIAEEIRRRLDSSTPSFTATSLDEGRRGRRGPRHRRVAARPAPLSDDVTGVVSVADDGGSTGRLRAMLNVAAVGDLRKCLGALADPENPLTASFEHRFSVGELDGHAVGNLLLVGLIDATGDLEESVRAVAQVMGVTGTIVPASCEGVVLVASTDEGPPGDRPRWKSSSIRRISVEPTNAAAPIAAVEAIERADLVVIGPGSLFTSVLAACVMPGITQALAGTAARRSTWPTCTPQVPETGTTRWPTTSTR